MAYMAPYVVAPADPVVPHAHAAAVAADAAAVNAAVVTSRVQDMAAVNAAAVAADANATNAIAAANAACHAAAVQEACFRAAAAPELVTVNPSIVSSTFAPRMMYAAPLAPPGATAVATSAALATNAADAVVHGIVSPKAYYN